MFSMNRDDACRQRYDVFLIYMLAKLVWFRNSQTEILYLKC